MMDKVLYGLAYCLSLVALYFLLHAENSSAQTLIFFSLSVSTFITGYVIGVLEDIRDAVVEDDGRKWWEKPEEEE